MGRVQSATGPLRAKSAVRRVGSLRGFRTFAPLPSELAQADRPETVKVTLDLESRCGRMVQARSEAPRRQLPAHDPQPRHELRPRREPILVRSAKPPGIGRLHRRRRTTIIIPHRGEIIVVAQTVLPFPARKGWILPRLLRLHLGEEEPHALIVRRIEPEHSIKDLLGLRETLQSPKAQAAPVQAT